MIRTSSRDTVRPEARSPPRKQQQAPELIWDLHLREFVSLALRDPRSVRVPAISTAVVYNVACCDTPEAAGFLYRKLSFAISDRAETVVVYCRSLHGESLAASFLREWRRWGESEAVIRAAFAFLDRSWIPSQRALTPGPNPLSLRALQSAYWRDTVLVPLAAELLDSVSGLVGDERSGRCGAETSNLIDGCMGAIVASEEPGVLKELEQRYLADLDAYLRSEGDRIFGSSADLESSVGLAHALLHSEEARSSTRLGSAACRAANGIAVKAVVARNREVLQTSFVPLLRDGRTAAVGSVFAMLKMLDRTALAPLRESFGRFVRAAMQQALEEETRGTGDNPEPFVRAMLREFRRFASVVAVSFGGDEALSGILDRAVRDVVTMRRPEEIGAAGLSISKAPSILARYCDGILRRRTKSQQQLSPEEMEAAQSDAVSLFRNFPDKDVFVLIYEKLLARRLLNDLSVSIEAEQSMVAKLRASQGLVFTVKLQRMIADIVAARQTNKDFAEHCRTLESQQQSPRRQLGRSGGAVVPLNVFVLTFGTWPLQAPSSSFSPPSQVTSALEAFRAFYDSRFPGRKLMFSHHLSRAELVRSKSSAAASVQLITTAYQLSILALFTKKVRSVTFGDMQRQTLLHEEILRQHLRPLLALGVLTGGASCSSNDGENCWGESALFTVNDSFVPKKPRVFTLPAKGEDSSGARSLQGFSVLNDRHVKLQAAVIRALKRAKVLSNEELLDQVFEGVERWFTPDTSQIKQAIEHLLDQEFIRRTQDNTGFEYVA